MSADDDLPDLVRSGDRVPFLVDEPGFEAQTFSLTAGRLESSLPECSATRPLTLLVVGAQGGEPARHRLFRTHLHEIRRGDATRCSAEQKKASSPGLLAQIMSDTEQAA